MSENDRRRPILPVLAATGAAVLTLTVLRRLDAYFADPVAVSAKTHYVALSLNMALSVAVYALVARAFGQGPK